MGIVLAVAGGMFASVGFYRVFEPSNKGVDGTAWLMIAAVLLGASAVCQALWAIERAVRDEREAQGPGRKVSRGVVQPGDVGGAAKRKVSG